MKIKYDGKEFTVISSEYTNTYQLETPYGVLRYFADHETTFNIHSFMKSGKTELKFYKNCVPFIDYIQQDISKHTPHNKWYYNDEVHIYNLENRCISIQFASNKAAGKDMNLAEMNDFMESVYDNLMKDINTLEHKKITKETNIMIKHLLIKKGILCEYFDEDKKEELTEAEEFKIMLSNTLRDDVSNSDHKKLTKETNIMLKYLLTKKNMITEITELLKDLKLE